MPTNDADLNRRLLGPAYIERVRTWKAGVRTEYQKQCSRDNGKLGGRPRKHPTNADRQKAYRQRRHQAARDWYDATYPRASTSTSRDVTKPTATPAHQHKRTANTKVNRY